MLELITGSIASILSGGVTGLLGIVIQRFFDWKAEQAKLETLKAKQAHEVAMVKANADLMAQEWAARTKVAEVEAEGRRDVADAQAFAESFKLEPKKYSTDDNPGGAIGRTGWFMLVLVDFVRGIVRPGLTIYLCAISTLMYYDVSHMIDEYGLKLGIGAANALISRVVETILYLTTVCLTWWFGVRPNKGPK